MFLALFFGVIRADSGPSCSPPLVLSSRYAWTYLHPSSPRNVKYWCPVLLSSGRTVMMVGIFWNSISSFCIFISGMSLSLIPSFPV